MNSDNYEYMKSSSPQSVSDYTSYVDKQWNYVNDSNVGIYQNNSGLTLVQWDLTSIASSEMFSDASDLYLTVPIVMVATTTNAAALVAPPTAGYALCSLKSNYQNILHQMDVVMDGKTIKDLQAFENVYQNFKLLSMLSATDLQSIGPSLNINGALDNEKSVRYNGAAGNGLSGVGLVNNLPFNLTAPNGVAIAQNAYQNNSAILNRVSRIVDTTANATYNKIWGTGGAIMTGTQLNNEFKPYYTVSNNVMTWYDVCIIPLKFVSDALNKLGLVKKLNLKLRCYFNTGSVQFAVNTPNDANCNYGGGSVIASTFQNTCPLTVNLISATSANGGIGATTTLLTAGVFIARAPGSIGSGTAINISGSGQLSHSMGACRCYYSQIKLDPQRAISYLNENRAKQVVFECIQYNQYNSISSGGQFSQLVQTGIKNPIGVAIIPFIASQPALFIPTQYGSPWDTSPATYSPISLINLQVNLGGSNVLNSTIQYTYEEFLSQVLLAETLTSTDIGVAVGLITQSWWESNRIYWVDLARCREADKETPRNVNISFQNNSQLTIDVMIFTIYLDRIVVDVQTGVVSKD